jgi:hypothetical protein
MSTRRQIVLPDPVGQQLQELAAGADTPPATLAAQMVQAGVAQAVKDGKVRPLRPSMVLVGAREGERAPWLEPYGGDLQWRQQMWGAIVALHGRYPNQLQALKDKWWTDESTTETFARSRHGEPNWTTAARTPATSSPSRPSSATTPSSYAGRAVASPRHGNPAACQMSGPTSRGAANSPAVLLRLGNEPERLDVAWPHHTEMPLVKRGDHVHLAALGQRDHRSVDHPQRQVEILLHQLIDTRPVRVGHRLDHQLAAREGTAKRKLGVSADPVGEQIGHLRNHECGDEQRPRAAGEQSDGALVVLIALGRRRIQGAGVHDQHYRRPPRRRATLLPTSSSTRSEASRGEPSPTAKKLNRPSGAGGSCFSIASRATSATDVPRRRASSRSRTSTSSGSMIVVRFIHTS